MPAETLNCPMCGAPTSTDAPQCAHCGAKADRTETADAAPELCPRCHAEMESVLIGKNHLRECPHCEGIWANADSLHKICADQEDQAAVLGMASHLPPVQPGTIEQNIRYLPCPVCKALMNRVNFANCSNVIVDVCSQHGTWFDRDELRRIVEFIHNGGMEKARVREIMDLNDARRKAAAAIPGGGLYEGGFSERTANYDLMNLGISAASAVLRALWRR